MLPRLHLLITELKEEGVGDGLKRIFSFLLRPITNLIKRNKFLVNLQYGAIPNLWQKLSFYHPDSKMIKLPQSELIKKIREFWYCNVPGDFDLDGEKITRKDIFLYGGPNPRFICSACQKSEWLSRVRQKNLFISHSCKPSKEGEHNKECEILCSYQGDELWTHFHQNFDFSIGCNSKLPATKGLIIASNKEYKEHFLNPRCEIAMLLFRRRLAYVCQIDIADKTVNINWSDYDFLFILNNGNNSYKFRRSEIPIIMRVNDFWPLENKVFQWMIDWSQPDVLLTSAPTSWKKNFKIPSTTKIVLNPFFDSSFFARPNLGQKELDLLVVGAKTLSSIYQPRIVLDKQIFQLTNRYNIEFSHSAGAGNTYRKGAVYRRDSRNGAPIRFLNKWSEYLGSAKYTVFGRMKYPGLTLKHYELLGSGTIPIFPESPDLKYLGIKPFEHYIPLSEIEGDNKRLSYYLDNYQKFYYIAENAVNWYKKVSDKMLFNDFEDLIGEITNYKYPKRLI